MELKILNKFLLRAFIVLQMAAYFELRRERERDKQMILFTLK